MSDESDELRNIRKEVNIQIEEFNNILPDDSHDLYKVSPNPTSDHISRMITDATHLTHSLGKHKYKEENFREYKRLIEKLQDLKEYLNTNNGEQQADSAT